MATGLSLTFALAGTPCELLATDRNPSSSLPLFVEGIANYCSDNVSDGAISNIARDINSHWTPNSLSLEEQLFDCKALKKSKCKAHLKT